MSKYPYKVYTASSYYGALNNATKPSEQPSANLQFANNNNNSRVIPKEPTILKPSDNKKPVTIETYNKRENQKSSNYPSYTYLGNQPTKVKEAEKTYLQPNNPPKAPQTPPKKEEERPPSNKGIVEYNREYFIQRYVKEALNDILARKFNPAVGSLKNYSPNIFEALAVFNTQFSMKIEQFSSIQSLMTVIKTDYMSLNKQRILKEGRAYYETTEKSKTQKLPIETIYDEVKKILRERPSTAKTNEVRQNYMQQPLQSQLTKKENEIKDLINKNQKASIQLRERDDYIAKLNKQMEQNKGELKKLNEELLKERQKSKEAANQSVKQNQLTNQVKQLKADLASYGPYKPSDFQNLKDSKSKSDKDVEVLREQLQKLKIQQQNQQLQAQKTSVDVNNLRSENERLNREKLSAANQLLLLKSKSEENAKAKATFQADNQKMKKQLEKLKAENDKLSKENSTLKTQSFEGTEQKKRKETEAKKYLEQLQQAKKELEEQRRLSSGKDQRSRSLEDDLARANREIISLKNNEKKYQQKLAGITNDISIMTQERNNLNYKIINMELAKEDAINFKKQKEQVQKTLKEKDADIEKLKASNKTASTNYESIKKSYDSLNISYEKLADENKKLTQEKNNLEQSLIQKDKQLSQTTAIKTSYLVKPYEADNGKVTALQNQIKQLKQELAQKDKECLDLKNKLKAANQQIQQLSEKEFNLSEELLNACKEVEELQTKLHNMQRERVPVRNDDKEKYQKQLKQKQTQIKDLMHQVETLNNMLSEREEDQRRIEETSNETNKLKTQIQSQENQINNLNKTIKQLEKTLAEQQQRRGTQSPNQKLQAENKRLQQKIQSLEKQVKMSSSSGGDSSSRMNLLYQHIILDDQFQYKKFLTEQIESHFRMQIKKTKLVYFFDPLNKVNFHKYIDKIDNLLVIVKTAKGAILAGYTQGSFQPKKVSAHDGLIISVTNGKVFTLIQPNKRAITYDDYYLLFGNSQIRIRSQQAKVFSNFGISNSYYASKGEKVSVLLGGTPQQREVETEGYEIYQVIYQ